jgi:hypothetical protein
MRYLKSFYLYESQVFDFDKWKSSILRIIEKIKNSEKLLEPDFNVIYHILRNPGNKDNYLSLGFTENDSKNWKSYFSNHKVFNSNGVWSQRDFNYNLKKELKDKSGDRTYNYYLTIEKTKENISKFWQKLPILDNQLKVLSDTKKTPISYKLHTLLPVLINDNDSFKIYYYHYSLKNDIENVVRRWIKDNDIKISNRTHTHGVDVAGDSYGELLAESIIKAFSEIIQKYQNKYTNEQYYEWLKTHMPDIIKSVKLKEE